MIWKKSDTDDPTGISQPQAPPQQPIRDHAQSLKERALIGPSIEIKGSLSGGEDLHVEGRIEGKIELRQHSITVGNTGHIKADIYGRTIVVHGVVDGNLFGEEQIILRKSSSVRGNLLAPRVTLEDGAQFKGSIDMTPIPAAEAPPLPAEIADSMP